MEEGRGTVAGNAQPMEERGSDRGRLTVIDVSSQICQARPGNLPVEIFDLETRFLRISNPVDIGVRVAGSDIFFIFFVYTTLNPKVGV